MILEIGSNYKVVSPDYGETNVQCECIESTIKRDDIILILEYLGETNEKQDTELYYHYKILTNNKIKYIVVWTKHDEIEKYLRKII